MAVAALIVALGRGEDAISVLGGGGGGGGGNGAGRRLRVVAGIVEGLPLVVVAGHALLRLGARDVSTRRSRVAGKLRHVWHRWLERGGS